MNNMNGINHWRQFLSRKKTMSLTFILELESHSKIHHPVGRSNSKNIRSVPYPKCRFTDLWYLTNYHRHGNVILHYIYSNFPAAVIVATRHLGVAIFHAYFCATFPGRTVREDAFIRSPSQESCQVCCVYVCHFGSYCFHAWMNWNWTCCNAVGITVVIPDILEDTVKIQFSYVVYAIAVRVLSRSGLQSESI